MKSLTYTLLFAAWCGVAPAKPLDMGMEDLVRRSQNNLDSARNLQVVEGTQLADRDFEPRFFKIGERVPANNNNNKVPPLDANAMNCQLQLPVSNNNGGNKNLFTAQALATPYVLLAPCSMSVPTQQSFAEAAVLDKNNKVIAVYHPLVVNQVLANGNTKMNPAAATPVVPEIPNGATVALWFGFNGGNLVLVDQQGNDANNSPVLKNNNCINGLPGVQNDVFGQVSWCNANQFWTDVNNAGIKVPALGTDLNGNDCPTSRAFAVADACPSDNLPTQYLLVTGTGQTAQDNAVNRENLGANNAANTNVTTVNNASDEALLSNILDPLIGCTPFLGNNLDDPGNMVPALALSELQAAQLQKMPISNVPINDPDCLTTADAAISINKTNVYRLGVDQIPVNANAANNNANSAQAQNAALVNGALNPYCQDLITLGPAFFQSFQAKFMAATSPDTGVGSTLYNFLGARVLMSIAQLGCPIVQNILACNFDGNGAAVSCVINTAGTVQFTTTPAAAAAPTSTTPAATKKKGGFNNAAVATSMAKMMARQDAAAAASPSADPAAAPVPMDDTAAAPVATDAADPAPMATDAPAPAAADPAAMDPAAPMATDPAAMDPAGMPAAAFMPAAAAAAADPAAASPPTATADMGQIVAAIANGNPIAMAAATDPAVAMMDPAMANPAPTGVPDPAVFPESMVGADGATYMFAYPTMAAAMGGMGRK